MSTTLGHFINGEEVAGIKGIPPVLAFLSERAELRVDPPVVAQEQVIVVSTTKAFRKSCFDAVVTINRVGIGPCKHQVSSLITIYQVAAAAVGLLGGNEVESAEVIITIREHSDVEPIG